MAGPPLYVDVSVGQGQIDWPVYASWGKQFTGQALACIKASEGIGYTDALYHANRSGSAAAGVSALIHYGYARPDLGNSPQAEAAWMRTVVGSIASNDLIMLDYEGYPGASNAPWTPEWALAWLEAQEAAYGHLPCIYSYEDFILSQLQDARLAKYPLILAVYTYNPAARPACPPPWTNYLALQFSDRATVPGIAGPVDCNVFFGTLPTPKPPERTTWMSAQQEAQALAYWHSTTIGSIVIKGNTTALVGIFPAGKAPNYNTGIAQSWQREYMNGRVWGAPLTYEFDEDTAGKPLTDWNGDPIVAQMFLGGRCEWHKKTNTARWYSWS